MQNYRLHLIINDIFGAGGEIGNMNEMNTCMVIRKDRNEVMSVLLLLDNMYQVNY